MEALPEEEQADEDEAVAEIEPALARQGPDGAGEEEDGTEGQQEREPVDLMFLGVGLFVGLVLLRFGVGQHIHAPEDRRQADEQGHVRDVVDERVGHHFRAGTAFGAKHKGEDQVAHARAVGHDERAEDRALDAALGHRFEPPDHEQRGGDEEPKETPRRQGAGALHPFQERIQGA